MLDDYGDQVTNTLEFHEYLERIVQILKGNPDIAEEDPFFIGWNDWWDRIKKVTHLEWQERYIDNVEKCFNAFIWEINNRKK